MTNDFKLFWDFICGQVFGHLGYYFLKLCTKHLMGYMAWCRFDGPAPMCVYAYLVLPLLVVPLCEYSKGVAALPTHGPHLYTYMCIYEVFIIYAYVYIYTHIYIYIYIYKHIYICIYIHHTYIYIYIYIYIYVVADRV